MGPAAFMPSVHGPDRYAGMHVQFDTMAMQMNGGPGKPPAAEVSLFPCLFSAVSNCSYAKVRSIISGQLRHKLILLFRRSVPIIIQRGAITVYTPVS